MKTLFRTLLGLIISGFLLFPVSGYPEGNRKPSSLLKYDPKIDGIIKQMTLEEKVEMLHGKGTFVSSGVERLGIADMVYADGPFGIREEMQMNGWASLGWETDKATFFPTGSALAATWSPDLAYQYGTGMAREARLRGKDMILGPSINIQRIPTGGRTYEYLSEDPYLSSRLSVAYTKGAQDQGVAICIKHYALNNQESNRGKVDVVVDERTMREIYLPPFRAAVEEADAYGVMSAYNKVNGWWCAENEMLLDKILRKEWGFAGMVISDWGGTHSTVRSVKSGLNVEMPGKQYLGKSLLDSVKAGLVTEELINQRVREILRVRMAIKPVPADKANKVVTSQPAQQKIAYQVASKSIVLLKNDGILPLKLDKKIVIAVIGDNATQKMATGGVGAGVKTLYEVTPLEGLKNRIGNKAELLFAQGYAPVQFSYMDMYRRKSPQDLEKEKTEKEAKANILTKEALELASKADIVLFFGGDNRSVETEGSDRKNIMLPSGQDELVKKIAAVNPSIVTILVSGGPNDLNVVNPLSKALLISWFNGTEGGNALADVLTGVISPSGRLPFTLPKKLEDSPAYKMGNFPQREAGKDIFANLVTKNDSVDKSSGKIDPINKNHPDTSYYSEGSLVGYRWYDTRDVAVMYPFGYGLTYSSFEYSNLTTNKVNYGKNDVISLSFELKNSGGMDADEVAQVYVHRINPKMEWPVKELKAFSRVTVSKEKTRKVTLTIPIKSLQYWNVKKHAWDDDSCKLELLVGSSAGDIKLKKEITLQ